MTTTAKTATKSKDKSRVLGAVQETAVDLHRLDFIDKRRMDQCEVLSMEPIAPYDREKIRALRALPNLSQSVLEAVL